MNCRPGDLAYVKVGPNFGAIVTVTSLDPLAEPRAPCWLFEGPRLYNVEGDPYISLRDSILRPIRGEPGDDETTVSGIENCEVPA